MRDGKDTPSLCSGTVLLIIERGPATFCWLPESKAGKEEAFKVVGKLNMELEPVIRDIWRVGNGMED